VVAVISQVLCKKVGGGRIASFEIMVTTNSIAQLIRENKTYRINSDIQTGAVHGMIGLDAHLLSLYNRDLISADEALAKSQLPDAMRDKLVENGAQFTHS
jgi:twitching motility protein PilT